MITHPHRTHPTQSHFCQRLSCFLGDKPTPPKNHFYVKLADKRFKSADLRNVHGVERFFFQDNKTSRQWRDRSADMTSYDTQSMNMSVSQGVVEIVETAREENDGKSKFVRVRVFVEGSRVDKAV